MASTFPLYAILVIVLGLMLVTWLATPKGPNQTYVAHLPAHYKWNLTILPFQPQQILQVNQNICHAHSDMLLPHVDGHVHGAAAPHHRCVLPLSPLFSSLPLLTGVIQSVVPKHSFVQEAE